MIPQPQASAHTNIDNDLIIFHIQKCALRALEWRWVDPNDKPSWRHDNTCLQASPDRYHRSFHDVVCWSRESREREWRENWGARNEAGSRRTEWCFHEFLEPWRVGLRTRAAAAVEDGVCCLRGNRGLEPAFHQLFRPLFVSQKCFQQVSVPLIWGPWARDSSRTPGSVCLHFTYWFP